jgi:hypothetical protein
MLVSRSQIHDFAHHHHHPLIEIMVHPLIFNI